MQSPRDPDPIYIAGARKGRPPGPMGRWPVPAGLGRVLRSAGLDRTSALTPRLCETTRGVVKLIRGHSPWTLSHMQIVAELCGTTVSELVRPDHEPRCLFCGVSSIARAHPQLDTHAR